MDAEAGGADGDRAAEANRKRDVFDQLRRKGAGSTRATGCRLITRPFNRTAVGAAPEGLLVTLITAHEIVEIGIPLSRVLSAGYSGVAAVSALRVVIRSAERWLQVPPSLRSALGQGARAGFGKRPARPAAASPRPPVARR